MFLNDQVQDELFFQEGMLVETLCDSSSVAAESSSVNDENAYYGGGGSGGSDGDQESLVSWLPARVLRKLGGDSLEVEMLGERDCFEVHESYLRNVLSHNFEGVQVHPADVKEGLVCSCWYAQGEGFFECVVDGCDEEDTAVVTFVEFDEQEEVSEQ